MSYPYPLSTLSTSTPLAGLAIWQSLWVDVTRNTAFLITVKTDQRGDLVVEYSTNGTDVERTVTIPYHTDQSNDPHEFTTTHQYIRVSFNNLSSDDQTELSLVTLLGDFQPISVFADQPIPQDTTATVVRPSDFATEVSLGLREGYNAWNKFGFNELINSGTPEIIASFGGTPVYNTTGETITINSSSADDAGGGTGVNRILLIGVDGNWNPQMEIVEMNGTTNVVTTSEWIGLNRVAMFQVGSGKANAGTINIVGTSSGNQFAQMPIGTGVTQQVLFYVPQGYQFDAQWLRFNVIKTGGGSKPEVQFLMKVYSAVNNGEQEVFRETLDTDTGSFIDAKPPIPFPIGEKSVIFATAETDQNNTAVRGRLSGILVRDIDYQQI